MFLQQCPVSFCHATIASDLKPAETANAVAKQSDVAGSAAKEGYLRLRWMQDMRQRSCGSLKRGGIDGRSQIEGVHAHVDCMRDQEWIPMRWAWPMWDMYRIEVSLSERQLAAVHCRHSDRQTVLRIDIFAVRKPGPETRRYSNNAFRSHRTCRLHAFIVGIRGDE